jgi:hypothetical protein
MDRPLPSSDNDPMSRLVGYLRQPETQAAAESCIAKICTRYDASGLIVAVVMIGYAATMVGCGSVRADQAELLHSDVAISRAKSWRLRINPISRPIKPDQAFDRSWMVVEGLPPDREHGWQHVDSNFGSVSSGLTRTVADLEYIRIGDSRYFRGGATPARPATPSWIQLSPRDMPPLGGFYNYRLHLTNPRTTGYSFDQVETTMWSNYRHVSMRPAELKTYSDHTCREWKFDWLAKDLPMHDSVCIGISDHLPYHLTLGGGWGEARTNGIRRSQFTRRFSTNATLRSFPSAKVQHSMDVRWILGQWRTTSVNFSGNAIYQPELRR